MDVDLPFIGRGGSLSARVADELAERILGGSLLEGQRLPSEPELSTQLGVSRSVIRDAIRTLAARGLVEVRHGYGTIVRAPSDDRAEEALFELLVRADLTVHDVWLAREALDSDLAKHAARARTEDDVHTMRERFAEMVEAESSRDWDRLERVHLAFHLGIADATHLPALRLILQPMQRIILLTGLPATGDPPWGVALHQPVMEAIAAGDAEAAHQAMLDHYSFIRDPAYAEIGAMNFRDAPNAQDRLRPHRVPPGG
jgi:DNA-binding FadR family transcriptional regulator